MENKSDLELYEDIANRMQKESDLYVENIISRSFEESDDVRDKDNDGSFPWIDYREKMIALRSFKIALGHKMAASGEIRYDGKEADDDFEKLLEDIQHVGLKLEIDEEVVSDALDCIAATSGMGLESRRMPLPEKEVTEELFFLLMGMAEYYQDNSYPSIAVHILGYFVDLSRTRNQGVPKKHREIVVRVLAALTDICTDACYRICVSEQEYFKEVQDEYTADFLWAFACAWQRKGETADAKKAFYQCYKLRVQLYGEECWHTAVAKCECSFLSLLLEDGEEEQKESFQALVSFIGRAEEGRYKEVDGYILEALEGKMLYAVLLYQLNQNDFHLYPDYLEVFGRICGKYNEMASEPFLKLRLHSNLRGIYYLKMGNFIQAEQAFQDAIHAFFPDGTEMVLSEGQMKSNLLLAYHAENDLEQAVPLLLDLLEWMDTDDSGLSRKDEYRILGLNYSLAIQYFLELGNEELDELKMKLEGLMKDAREGVLFEQNYAPDALFFLIVSVQFLFQNGLARDDCKKYFDVLRMVKRTAVACLENAQRIVLCLVLSQLAWELHSPAASVYIREAVELGRDAVIPIPIRVAVLQTAAVILSKQGEAQAALAYLRQSLTSVTEMWQSYIRYFNDSRLLQILSPMQLVFSSCYAVMREQENDVWALYENVLQYKALASLAGKERNRLLRAGIVEGSMLERMKDAQDRMAAIESGNIFLTSFFAYEKEKEYLRSLEAEFARNFPRQVDFVPINISDILARLPDHAAVVEYFLNVEQYGLRQAEVEVEGDLWVYDVFVLKKLGGEPMLQRIVIPHAEEISEEAVEFLGIFQDESAGKVTRNQMDRKEILRLSLYQGLVEPIIPFLSDVSWVFLAPDGDAINLPFDILGNENGELLGDRFLIIKMECARDFLFGQAVLSEGKGSFIMGNPQFQVKESDSIAEERKSCPDTKEEKGCLDTEERKGRTDTEKRRDCPDREERDCPNKAGFAKIRPEDIKQLPFAEVEAQIVGAYCGSAYLTGKEANRRQFLCCGSNRNIHLATHGYYDLSEETDSLYSSCLLFAGVKDWLESHISSEEYGTGIVTADEISRLDFHGVELAVLSSCLTGMNSALFSKGFQGIVGGFSAAGVKYVISNLWRADDLATAILMGAFYYQYRVKKLAPPVALKEAQRYVREVSVQKLKAQNWFISMLQNDAFNTEEKSQVRELMCRSDRLRPFKDECYWAGFTCFRCN